MPRLWDKVFFWNRRLPCGCPARQYGQMLSNFIVLAYEEPIVATVDDALSVAMRMELDGDPALLQPALNHLDYLLAHYEERLRRYLSPYCAFARKNSGDITGYSAQLCCWHEWKRYRVALQYVRREANKIPSAT